MSEPTWPVECEHHGPSHATFVCQHLARGQGRGFFTPEPDSDPRPDAWCFACEQVVTAVGAWNDESETFASIRVLCSGCYDDVRHRNSDIRPSIDVDGWCLGTRADVLAATPGFDFPAPERVACVREGEYVKALFYVVGSSENEPYVQGERMWVRVVRHSDGWILGTLASEPETLGSLVEGADVEVPYHLVIDVYSDVP
jgi:hypothetical protein